MNKNKNLNEAKKNKNDEFYTLYQDIENAVSQIKDKLKDKIVYCNCDDPKKSNFYKYFKDNFKALNLKKLYCSFYDKKKNTYLTIIKAENEIETIPLNSGNCFDDECIKILKESDIVITNPPFSLLKDFLKMLLFHNKDFLIIGNMNVTNVKDLFPYFRDRKINVWNYKSMYFKIPNSYEIKTKEVKIFEDSKCVKVSNAKWISNFENPFSIDKFISKIKDNHFHNLKHKYTECHNVEALNINSLADIPMDYKGLLAVPCNIFEYLGNKENNLFEIIGYSSKGFYKPKNDYINAVYQNADGKKVKGTKGHKFFIHHDTKPVNKGYFICDNFEGYFTLLYARILVKIKNH